MDMVSVNTFGFKLSDDHAIDSPKKLSPPVAPVNSFIRVTQIT